MSRNFIGLAFADSMFIGDCTIKRRELTTEEVKRLLEVSEVESCCNPSHEASLAALDARYGIKVGAPEVPPKVVLARGDMLVVMGIRGLPRLTDRHEYTPEEVAAATFAFTAYTVE